MYFFRFLCTLNADLDSYRHEYIILICHNFSSSLNQFIALVLKVVGVGVELYVHCLCAFTYMVHPNNFQTGHLDVVFYGF